MNICIFKTTHLKKKKRKKTLTKKIWNIFITYKKTEVIL